LILDQLKGIDQFSVFANPPLLWEVAEDLFARGLCLPSGTAMTEEDLERVVSVIRKCFRLEQWVSSKEYEVRSAK